MNIINDLKPLTIFTKCSISMFHKVLCTPLLKLQVLFIKRTSSKFIVTHFEGIAIFDVIFARINETYDLSAMERYLKILSFYAIVCWLQIQKQSFISRK